MLWLIENLVQGCCTAGALDIFWDDTFKNITWDSSNILINN